MSLRDRITSDMKDAMRAKDAARLLVVRGLLAAIKQREVDERITLDDAAIVGVIDKLIKQRRDAIAAFDQGGRADLADKERAEAEVLQGYLPRRLGADEMAQAVDAVLQALAAELGRAPVSADMGRAMAAAKAQLAGRADIAAVSQLIKQRLAGGTA